jgi:SpoIID/LytB domain protein
VVLALVAVLAMGFVRGDRTQAAGTFTFYGSGNGHGIGMSQWGAYGLARAGWGYQRILRHFFQGTAITSHVRLPRTIRVGLTYDRETVHLRAKDGPVGLWITKPLTGNRVGRIPRGKTWTVRAAADGYAIRDHNGDLVGGQTWGGPAFHLFATYEPDAARVLIQEAGASYKRGYVEFNLYQCSDGCRERLIAVVGFEEYLYGLGEVPSSWPMDALRAQATAARSYAAYVLKRYGLRGYCNCDITDGAGDQVYVGYAKEGGPDGDRWVAAARGTRGRVVAYEGRVIQAFYASSDGGHTENVEDVWHGGDPAYAIPWLRGVCDPGESTAANPWTKWSKTLSASAVSSRLRPYTGDIGAVTEFTDFERGESGRIIRVKVRGGQGNATVSGTTLKTALGLWDTRVWVNTDRTIVGEIRETYDAEMCRPGLPASKRITLGHGIYQRFEVGSIARNNGADVTVWLKGAIDAEYRSLGGPTGRLRLPTSKVLHLSCHSCGRVVFERGRIYWKGSVGAFALWGRVLRAYLDASGPGGSLGFPTSRPSTDGAGTWSASFQQGAIVCPSGAACTVSS